MECVKLDNLNLYLAVNNQLETKRLRLRPITLADAADMFEYASIESNTYYVFNKHQTIEDTQFSIANYFMASPLGKYAIELKEEKKMIGTIDLRVDIKKRKAELGYVLNQAYFKKGYATEAASKLVEFAFETLELEKVTATCDSRNTGSEAVMKRLGMQQEGRSRHHEIWKNGEWIDMLYYSVLKDEYFSHKNSEA